MKANSPDLYQFTAILRCLNLLCRTCRRFASLVFIGPSPFFLVVLSALIIGLVQSSSAQQKQKKESIPKKVYTTKRISGPTPEIDGHLDDAAWTAVEWGGAFTQRMPDDGAAPFQQTAFKILYDDKNLYIAIRAFDTEPGKIEQRMSRRDGFEGDWVEVNIDSYHDQRTAFSFTASVSGVKGDEAISNDGDNWDDTWDPIWYLQTRIDDQGWTAEYRIPLSQLRFSDEEQQVWGLEVNRRLFRKDEVSNWQYIPKNAPGWVHLFGELRGLSGLKRQKQIEIQPYTVARTETSPKEPGNPFATGKSSAFRAGLDGKIGLTSNVTLDFTVNPDFGQVEADPSQVNLSAFEVFYQERRPFFVESRNILDYQVTSSVAGGSYTSDNLFYSRRIGRPPQRELDAVDGRFVRQPSNTNILTAAKLTGKTAKGLSFALLESVTDRARADIDFNGNRSKTTVEPLANYLVGRVQKDFNKGETILGAMFTATNRNTGQLEVAYLSKYAYSGGIDFKHLWKKRTYFVAGNAIFSRIGGTAEAILAEQTASQRYFQRPMAGYVRVDSSRTSLTGTGGTLRFGKSGSGHLNFESGLTYRSPRLELNDLGYMRSADQINWWAWMGYQILQPFSVFRNLYANVNAWSDWDFGGTNTNKAFNFNFNGQLKNYWRVGAGITPNLSTVSNADLRGGPALRYPGGSAQWAWVNTDDRKKLQFNFQINSFRGNERYSRSADYSLSLSYRPVHALVFSVAPTYSTYRNALQYVGTQVWNSDPRYITGQLDQKTLSTTFRVDYTINPNLSIQYYAQPFVSKGIYGNFNRIVTPGSKVYTDRFALYQSDQIEYNKPDNSYSIDENADGNADYRFPNPDFTFMQLRSNLVVRWEYTPGSTLFVVWSQNKTANPDLDRFGLSQIARNLVKISGQNIFLIKFTYRFIF